MRRYSPFCRSLALAGLCIGAAACHHNSSAIPTTTATANAAGIWTGTDAVSGFSLTGVIDAAGDAMFIRSDGMLFAGTLLISEATLSGTLDGYSPLGTTFADGTDFGLGTFGGSVVSATSIDATWNFTTVESMTTNNIWSLSFDPLWRTASSVTAIAGTYKDSQEHSPTNGATVTISSTGAISGTSATTGCVLSGQVTANTPANDVYSISLSYASCTDTVLNGIHFTGFGILNSSVTPAVVLTGVTGEASNQTNPNLLYFGLVMTLTAG
jgi:hypothetical protein